MRATTITAHPVLIEEVNQPDSLKHIVNGVEFNSEALADLADYIHRSCVRAGWWDNPREYGTLLALIHSEVSESLEGFRKNLQDDHLPEYRMDQMELVDTIYRLLDLLGAMQALALGEPESGYFPNSGRMLLDKFRYNQDRADHKRGHRAGEHGKVI